MQYFTHNTDPVANISRSALVLDTNVLVATFYPEDEDPERARNSKRLVMEGQEELVVLVSTIIEACGVIKSRSQDSRDKKKMLNWFETPGRARIIPDLTGPFEGYLGDSRHTENDLDSVDAILAYFANDTLSHGLNHPLTIATHDKGDYFHLLSMHDLKLRLYNFQTGNRESFY